MNREELAWAAGFFDGEGTVCARFPKPPRKVPQMVLRIRQAYSDKEWIDLGPYSEVLERFQDAIGGLGILYGPYLVPDIRPQAAFEVNRFEHIQQVMCMLWPWLGTTKKDQFTRTFRTYYESFANLTGT